jgi:uncharacterized protein (DUF2141 family)
MMIRIFITAVLYLISLLTQAQGNSSQENQSIFEPSFAIEVMIGQMKSDEGTVYFGLYASEKDFANRNYMQGKKVKADKDGVVVSFENIPKGVYAISCFYDANDNGKMDFDQNGMPMEDYGSTNNVMNFGPPRFSDAKFEVSDKDLTFEIRF